MDKKSNSRKILQTDIRYDGIDIMKVMCAFLVVCIHVHFAGIFGEYFTALCRVAVPIFFMVTGFFYDNSAYSDHKIIQIKRIISLLIVSNILYFVWGMILAARGGVLLII